MTSLKEKLNVCFRKLAVDDGVALWVEELAAQAWQPDFDSQTPGSKGRRRESKSVNTVLAYRHAPHVLCTQTHKYKLK